MSRRNLQSWLLRLCDPQGAVNLPVQRLKASELHELLVLADEHGVAGAVIANLSKLSSHEGNFLFLFNAFSAADQAQIDAALCLARRKWFEFVALTLSLRQRTAEVLAALDEVGLPAAIIKGEDFADRLYHPSGLRPFRDIDFILPKYAMSGAAELMRTLGYREILGKLKHDHGYGEQVWDSIEPPRNRVELHWNLINSPAQRKHSSLTFEDLQWERTSAGQRTFWQPSAGSMLLIAGVHAVLGHRFDRLQHLCDLRQLCRGVAGPLNLDWLREAAAPTGASHALHGALEVAGRLLDDPSCKEVLAQLRLPGASAAWRFLVRRQTLLFPNTTANKIRRTVVREWMKRAA